MSPKELGVTFTGDRDESGRPIVRVDKGFRFRIGPWAFLRVPAGFHSNLGSIPRWAWWFVPPGAYPFEFIGHDYACNEDNHPFNHDENPENDIVLDSGFSRWMADAILYEMLCRANAPWRHRWLIWVACRLYTRTIQYRNFCSKKKLLRWAYPILKRIT